jgi:hypothetical protein
MGWAVRGSNPGGGEIFRTRPDRPWGPPSLVYNGGRVMPGGEVKRPGRGVEHTLCSAEVKERIELYLYFPTGSSWPVLGWTLLRWKGRSLLIESRLCRRVSKLVRFLFEMLRGRLHVLRTKTRISEKAYSIYDGYLYVRIPTSWFYGFFRAVVRCPAKFVSERQEPRFVSRS